MYMYLNFYKRVHKDILRTIIDSAIKQGIHPFKALEMPNIIIN